MTRIAALSLALTLSLGFLAPLASAQDGPASQPAEKTGEKGDEAKPAKLDPRVMVDALATLDEKPVAPNGLQYFLYERFNYFRFRVDSKHKIGQKPLDKFIAKMNRFWTKRDPENKQKPEFTVVARQTVKYSDSKFYGEAQAHNYKGTIKVELKDAAGTVIETIEFGLSWGRLLSSGLSKRQVQVRYDQMVHTAAAIGLLNHPKVKAHIKPKYQQALLKWSKTQRKNLLKVLEGSTDALKNGDMAKYVRGLKLGASK